MQFTLTECRGETFSFVFAASQYEQQVEFPKNPSGNEVAFVLAQCRCSLIKQLRVRLYWCESESDIVSRWVHKESNLMFTLNSDKNQRKEFAFGFAMVQYKLTITKFIYTERKQIFSFNLYGFSM